MNTRFIARATGAFALIFGLAIGAAHAQNTPIGTWKQFDDKTKEAKSEITLVDNGGVISGKISKRLLKDVDPNAVCTKCEDDRKDKPILGLEIIRGLKKEEGKDVWSGGKIINPEDGKVYSVTMTPIEGGQKLEVHGYIGVKLLGRTQVWTRLQ